jgi:hypothetical protein
LRIVRIVRNVEFSKLFDAFFIAAISTILATRFYLEITGYPQISTDRLHISHLLPGALLMLLAILAMLIAVNRSVRDFSAIVAGIGFGLVWDEIGKFTTKNNDYFLQEAPGLIYLTFVGLYLAARYVEQKRLTQDEYIANVIDLLKDAAIKDLDPREYEHAKELMAHVSPRHTLYGPTLAMLDAVKPSPEREPLLIDKVIYRLVLPLRRLSEWEYFARLVIFISIIFGLISVAAASFFLYGAVVGEYIGNMHFPLLGGDQSNWIAAGSALISAIYVAVGVYLYRRGRHSRAYRIFETALLINLFVGQVVLFFKNPWIAMGGLAITLTLLISVKVLISEESHRRIREVGITAKHTKG